MAKGSSSRSSSKSASATKLKKTKNSITKDHPNSLVVTGKRKRTPTERALQAFAIASKRASKKNAPKKAAAKKAEEEAAAKKAEEEAAAKKAEEEAKKKAEEEAKKKAEEEAKKKAEEEAKKKAEEAAKQKADADDGKLTVIAQKMLNEVDKIDSTLKRIENALGMSFFPIRSIE